jgi:hypothetical protein
MLIVAPCTGVDDPVRATTPNNVNVGAPATEMCNEPVVFWYVA